MASKTKKRRIRSPHPGVVLISPKGEHATWRARCDDPETDGTKWVRLDPVALTTAETRRDWAIRKSKEIARVRMELELGGKRTTKKPLEAAIDGYFTGAENRLRESTVDLYRAATAQLKTWAAREGIHGTDQLVAARLPSFRDFLLSHRKQVYVTGAKKRGARRVGRERLSPQTINWQLRAVKTVLNDLRMRGIVPLSSDAIADALKPVTVPREAPEFFRPAECRQLLEAALRHDAETYAATRGEHAVGAGGATPRYEPIAPFAACVLLSGMRLNEALALRWAAVELNALDADGKVVGEIRLKAGETKTHHARTIGLDVSPTLRALLDAMKEHAGGAPYVFGGRAPMSRTLAEAARRRLIGAVPETPKKSNPKKKRKTKPPATYGAPKEFTWQLLRSTCATYQCNAPSLFGAAAAFVSAKRLGHSITVSEKHYAGLFAVSREARTLESAMGIEDVMGQIVALAMGRAQRATVTT